MTLTKHILCLVCCTSLVLAAGCNTTGPNAIRGGRLAYNTAINETNNQQMLAVVVNNRYAETSNLLSVTSVTANINVSSRAAIEIGGSGNADDYAGNLVPFSAGVIYEENPTITYKPVGGQQFLRQLTAPLPVAAVAQLTGTLNDPTLAYRAIVSSINGIYNPDLQIDGDVIDPRFDEVIAVLARLTRIHRLHWVEDPPDSQSYAIVIDPVTPADRDDVDNLLALLEVSGPRDTASAVVLPVTLALHKRQSNALAITTRSVLRLMEMLSAAVEVPEADINSGIALDYPPPGPAVSGLRVRYSDTRPDSAAVAFEHRDGWFYIDDSDLVTKQFFRLLGLLWSVSIAETTDSSHAEPVLTVPVSR